MFKVRTNKPDQWNKLYNNSENGGISWCINGSPKDYISNVLANCVGYACARFNEVYNIESGYDYIKYPQLCCNAEDFWTRADSIGLKKGQEPKVGAIMVWEGLGSAAGHVAIVERVNNQNQVYTSESGYGGPFFWNAVRYKGDGNWGTGAGYRFLGFIYNPAIKELTWKHEWHLYEDGKEVTGWKKVDDKWYYMNSAGAMQVGWQFINNRWYYLDESGAMLTGWKEIRGKWYYLQEKAEDNYKEGEMRTGWLYDSIHYKGWFLLSNNGDMLTGWQKVKDKWYYLAPSTTNSTIKGKMVTGWLKDKDKWYYLDPSNGHMYSDGTFVIDGKKYTFDKSGALV